MVTRLNPYINFDGNARQAMEFYREVFGENLSLNTFGEFGMAGPDSEKIMHATLETDEKFTLMAADLPAEMSYKPGENVAVSLSGDQSEALRGYWEKLSKGGDVMVPLEKQMWGDEFGMCADRFGVRWMVDIGQSEG